MAKVKVSFGGIYHVIFSVSNFDGNCGYNIIYGDSSTSYIKNIPETHRKYLNKLIMFKLVNHPMCMHRRMFVLSELVSTGTIHRWFYHFIIDNNLSKSKPVKENVSGPSERKTILSFFSPYELHKTMKKPRKPKTFDFNPDDLVINFIG